MKAVFSALQLAHAPTRFLSRGHIVDYPESPDRGRALLEGARQAGAEIFGARRYGDEVFATIHAPRYLNFLKSAFGEWSKLEGAAPELLPSLRPGGFALHESHHIMAQAGRFMMDMSCAITERTWMSVAASAQTALTAADLSLKGEGVVYALCRPPGHHAYANRAGGFCYLNNSALAAERLRGSYERVAILDIDVHHGNGTQAIFYKRPDVLTVSIHADPTDYYPYYWGGAAETGEGDGKGYNLNIPLPVGSGDDVWLEALGTALDRIEDYNPGALVIALGLDAHEADPLRGGSVTQAGFARFAEIIASLSLPTVIVQEGGYLTEHLADNLGMFLAAYEGAHRLPEPEQEEPVPDIAAGPEPEAETEPENMVAAAAEPEPERVEPIAPAEPEAVPPTNAPAEEPQNLPEAGDQKPQAV